MTVLWWLLLLPVLWVLFNLAAPYTVFLTAQPISTGRLPAELLIWPEHQKVRFYVSNLLSQGYGYSVWAPPHNLVVFDKTFFANASPSLIRYVVAHELAHFSFGHHRKRWFCIVTGMILIPSVYRWLLHMEDEADAEAARRTGFNRKLFPELGGV